jgi:hypothetical protein
MFLECHDQFREHIWRDRGNRANRERAGDLTLEFVYATAGIADRRQNLSRIINQTTAGFSEHN